jgi:hypothetical protein
MKAMRAMKKKSMVCAMKTMTRAMKAMRVIKKTRMKKTQAISVEPDEDAIKIARREMKIEGGPLEMKRGNAFHRRAIIWHGLLRQRSFLKKLRDPEYRERVKIEDQNEKGYVPIGARWHVGSWYLACKLSNVV